MTEDGKRDSPRYSAQTGDEDDEESSFSDDMRHASIIQIVSLVSLRSGSTPILESNEITEL